MSAHQYRVTLEYLGGNHAGPELHKPIRFETGNDDDLFETVGKLHRAGLWAQDDAAALAVGMKLFGDIAIANQGDPLFERIADDLREFNGKFKQSVKEALEQQAKAQGKGSPWEPEID